MKVVGLMGVKLIEEEAGLEGGGARRRWARRR